MEFSEIESYINSPSSKKDKEKSKELEIDDYIPYHNDFLKEIKSTNNQTADEILKDIDSMVFESSEQEILSNQEIPSERFENIPRSKTEEFYLSKRKFTKINNKELFQSFSLNKQRRKSSLSQSFSFCKVLYFCIFFEIMTNVHRKDKAALTYCQKCQK